MIDAEITADSSPYYRKPATELCPEKLACRGCSGWWFECDRPSHSRRCEFRGVTIETVAERDARESAEARERTAQAAGYSGVNRYPGRCGRCSAEVPFGLGGWRREGGRVVVYCLDRGGCDVQLAKREAQKAAERRAKIEREEEAKAIAAARRADEQATRAAIVATYAVSPPAVVAVIAGADVDATTLRGAQLEPYADDSVDRETVIDHAGHEAVVPVYGCRPGESLEAAARRIGGRTVTRREAWTASQVVAVVSEDPHPARRSTSNSRLVVRA